MVTFLIFCLKTKIDNYGCYLYFDSYKLIMRYMRNLNLGCHKHIKRYI